MKTQENIDRRGKASISSLNLIIKVATTESSRVSLKRMSAESRSAVPKALRLTAKVVVIIIGAIIGLVF